MVLTKIVVVELGYRLAVSVCGSLLAELGTTVVLIEPKRAPSETSTKWDQRSLTAAGKRSLAVDIEDAADRKLLQSLLVNCDVVLTSGDVDPPNVRSASEQIENNIRCDITAFGNSGPMAGKPYSDVALQALSGVIDTTGSPDGRPIATRIPIIELTSGVWAAAAVVAALRARRTQGILQPVDIAMYDCAVTTLATFLPKYFAGEKIERIGNHHPSLSPWNAYPTKDGWIQLCTGSTEHWLRMAEIIGSAAAYQDPRFATSPLRLRWNDELDRLIEGWTKTVTLGEAMERISRGGIPCGPVCTVNEMLLDPNLSHRDMVRSCLDPLTGENVRIPGAVLGGNRSFGRGPTSIPDLDEGRADIGLLVHSLPRQHPNKADAAPPTGPLSGIRVIEIGQWTTAPLAARQLASLGADVVKIEPPGGDGARSSAPHADGESYLFNLNNSDKRCIEIDMRTEKGRLAFTELVRGAHVLVENLKPGSLARFGFSPEALARLNAQLIYCAISGFGARSIYPGRPAMDTVLQAMCGVMDLTRSDGVPYKIGISVSDLMGGHFGFLAILAALESCAQSGQGQFIDLSMQDITAWATQLAWNHPVDDNSESPILKCCDGYVLVLAGEMGSVDKTTSAMSRAELIEWLLEKGITGIPILSVAEVAADPQTVARRLIRSGNRTGGRAWPLLASPIRFEKSQTIVQHPPRNLGADYRSIVQEWQALA
jgi:crotonobetainyl-CoA:carnitine CoA-transferase CaiB-like acyl-CoA transferase